MKPKSVRMTSTEKEPRSTKSPLNICRWLRKTAPFPLFFPHPPHPTLPPVPSAGGYVGVGLGGQPVELEDVQQVVVLPVGVPAHRHLLRLRLGPNVTTQSGGGGDDLPPPGPPTRRSQRPAMGTHLLQRRFYQGGQLGQHLLHLHQDLLGQTGSRGGGDTTGDMWHSGDGVVPTEGLWGGSFGRTGAPGRRIFCGVSSAPCTTASAPS